MYTNDLSPNAPNLQQANAPNAQANPAQANPAQASPPVETQKDNEKLTILLASDDFDRAFLAFMLSMSARSMGMEVNIFFALWGLNLLRRENDQPGMDPDPTGEKKGFMEKMMAMMMPKGPNNVGLSKMNFGGMGAMMMKGFMKKNGIASLAELMDMAVEAEVEFTVCSMTMEIMGIKNEELLSLPNAKFGGVASCMGSALQSKMFLVV